MKLLKTSLFAFFLYCTFFSAMGQINASITLFDGRQLDILSEIDSIPLITINEQGQIYKTLIDVDFEEDSIIINNEEVIARSFHILLWIIIDETNNDLKIKYLEGTTSYEDYDVQLLHSQLKEILSKWRFVGNTQELHDIDYYHLDLSGHIECYIKI